MSQTIWLLSDLSSLLASGHLQYHHEGPTLMTSSTLNYFLPKGSTSKTITLGVKASTYKMVGGGGADTIQSIAGYLACISFVVSETLILSYTKMYSCTVEKICYQFSVYFPFIISYIWVMLYILYILYYTLTLIHVCMPQTFTNSYSVLVAMASGRE